MSYYYYYYLGSKSMRKKVWSCIGVVIRISIIIVREHNLMKIIFQVSNLVNLNSLYKIVTSWPTNAIFFIILHLPDVENIER